MMRNMNIAGVSLAFLLACALIPLSQSYYWGLIFADYPVEIREGGPVSIAYQFLQHGWRGPYSDASTPGYFSVYGVGYPLFILPFTLVVEDLFHAMRLAGFVAAALTVGVFFLICWRLSRSILWGLGCATILAYALPLHGAALAAYGDQVGLLFGLLPVLCLVSFRAGPASLLAAFLFAFYSGLAKPYYVFFGAVAFLWLPMEIGWRRALLFWGAFSLLFAAVILFIDWLWPWYFWAVFFQYSSYLGGSVDHLVKQIDQYLLQIWPWLGLTALALAAALGLRFARWRRSAAGLERATESYYGLGFTVFQLIIASLAISYMSQNTGRSLTYFDVLFLPPLLMVLAASVGELKLGFSWAAAMRGLIPALAGALFVAAAAWPLYPLFMQTANSIAWLSRPTAGGLLKALKSRADLNKQKDFAELRQYAAKGPVLGSPWIAYIALEDGTPLVDSSHTQCFRGPIQDDRLPRKYFGLQLGKHLVSDEKKAKARKMWEDHIHGVERAIDNKEYTMIAFEGREANRFAPYWLGEYATYYAFERANPALTDFVQQYNKAVDDFYDRIERNYTPVKDYKNFGLTLYLPKP